MSELFKQETPEENVIKKPQKDNKAVSGNSRRHFKYRSNKCLNCSQPLDLSDRYCPYCSQLNSTKPLSLKDFIAEFFSSFVSYDSRLRFTIKDLLFKPGTITRNYISGERLKYTNPFRFFLSVSIIYFLVYGVLNFFDPSLNAPFVDINNSDNTDVTYDKKEGNFYLNDEAENIEEAIDQLEANPATTKWATLLKEKDSIRKAKIKNRESTIQIINGDTINKYDYENRVKLIDSMGNVQGFFRTINLMQDFYTETEINHPETALDSLKIEKSKVNLWLYKKNNTLDRIKDDPYKFAEFLFSKTPIFLFFFAPFFALFFWLLYARRPFTYMEHLVFIFHIFSFVFLVMLLLALPDLFIDISIPLGIFFTLIGPFYFYKALRNFYKQSRLKTVIKFVILNFVFLLGASTAAILFFIATAATY